MPGLKHHFWRVTNSHHIPSKLHDKGFYQNCDIALSRHFSYTDTFIGRGVRSDAQLSCTETQFQKCSQSGKNGSKHPMLPISMAYNVISCKKVERNTQKLKIADFTM